MQYKIFAVLCLGILASAALADGPDKAEYEACGKSRADAEVAVRQAQDFFTAGDQTWREVTLSLQAARAAADDALMRRIDAEEKKPEDQRKQSVIDDAEQARHDLDARWQHYGVDRAPALESAFHDAEAEAENSAELLHVLEDVETRLKESGQGLAPLASLYDETAASAASAESAGQGALDSLKKIDQSWEPATQPSGD